MGTVWQDVSAALLHPPPAELDREILYARLRSYWARVQYILWNAVATMFVYLFPDSMFNVHVRRNEYRLLVIFHCIQCLSIVAYFMTSFVDPGYIDHDKFKLKKKLKKRDRDKLEEQQTQAKLADDDYKYIDMNTAFKFTAFGLTGGGDETDDAPFPYEITCDLPEYSGDICIDTETAPSNFCWRCRHIRPIRSKHCYDCDRCVGKFDHHCPMVGNCVAGRNHRFFVLFMTSQTIVVLWAFCISFDALFQLTGYIDDASTVANDNDSSVAMPTGHPINRGPLGWFLRMVFFVGMFFAVFITVGLSGYHLYLASQNLTTYEMIKPQNIESYLKDEMQRKKWFTRKQQKKNIARLQQQQQQIQQRIDELQHVQPVAAVAAPNGDSSEAIAVDMNAGARMGKNDDAKYEDTDEDEMPLDAASDVSDSAEQDALNSSSSRMKRSQTPKPRTDRQKQRLRETAYPNYFDEGLSRNIYMFLTGTLYAEWMTPLPCTVARPPQRAIAVDRSQSESSANSDQK